MAAPNPAAADSALIAVAVAKPPNGKILACFFSRIRVCDLNVNIIFYAFDSQTGTATLAFDAAP